MAFPYSSGDVLTAAALNASSGLVLVKSQTIGSGVSSVTVTDAFSSTFQNYRIVVSNIDSSVGGQTMLLQMGGQTTAYYGISHQQSYGTGSGAPAPTVLVAYNGANWPTTMGHYDRSQGMVIDVYSPHDGVRTQMSGHGYGWDSAGFFGGQIAATTSFTTFTLITGSGTMTGGTIRVYGYNDG